MHSSEEGEANVDPLALLAALVRNVELLADGDDDDAACLLAQQALERARADRADGLQQVATILQAGPRAGEQHDVLSGALER